MVRIGIIGYGQQGKLYTAILAGISLPGMPAIPKPQDCVLTAISARSEVCKAQIEALGVHYFQNWQDLIASDCCDAIVITVPHFFHHEIAIAAIKAGKHVLCEKPMTIRASDAQSILDAQKAHPETKFAMMLNQRANPLLQKIKAVIHSGELGTMRSSYYITNRWWRPDSYYASNPWRGTWGGEGGGILVNQACHPLDLWIWLCGMPETIYARCREGAYRNIDVDNDVTVLARYPNGGQGVFIACSHDLLGTDRLEINFEKGKILIEENRKATVLRYTQPEGSYGELCDFRTFQSILMQSPDTVYQKEELIADNAFCQDYVQMFQNFAGFILKNEEPIVSAQAGLMQVQLANAIQLSGWTGQEVTLPGDAEAYNRLLEQKIREEAGQ